MADEGLVTFIAARLGGATHSGRRSLPLAANAAPPDVNLKVMPSSSSEPAEAAKHEETEQKDLMGLLGDLWLEPDAKRQRCSVLVEASEAEESQEFALSSDVTATLAKEDLTSKDGSIEGGDGGEGVGLI